MRAELWRTIVSRDGTELDVSRLREHMRQGGGVGNDRLGESKRSGRGERERKEKGERGEEDESTAAKPPHAGGGHGAAIHRVDDGCAWVCPWALEAPP